MSFDSFMVILELPTLSLPGCLSTSLTERRDGASMDNMNRRWVWGYNKAIPLTLMVSPFLLFSHYQHIQFHYCSSLVYCPPRHLVNPPVHTYIQLLIIHQKYSPHHYDHLVFSQSLHAGPTHPIKAIITRCIRHLSPLGSEPPYIKNNTRLSPPLFTIYTSSISPCLADKLPISSSSHTAMLTGMPSGLKLPRRVGH